MPKKVRELKAALRKAGFRWRPGKGSHNVWEHPLADKPVTLLGNDGRDARAVPGSPSRRADRARSEPAVTARYSLLVQWSEEDQVFIAMLPEFGNAMTHGETYEKAAKQGRLLIESFILWYGQDGKPLPQPALFDMGQLA